MIIKTNIKLLVLLTLVLSICASAVSAQKKPTTTKQNIWQEVKLDVWELKFSIPKDLKAIPQMEDEKPNFSEDDYNESKVFKRSIPKASRLEMYVYLRNFKGETVKTENKGKDYNMTPADLLLLDFIGEISLVKQANSPALEANYYEIDGVNGILEVMNVSFDAGKSVKPTNDIRVIWGTYRLFKGNVQQINFTIEGKRTQLETMKKIIDSLKFS